MRGHAQCHKRAVSPSPRQKRLDAAVYRTRACVGVGERLTEVPGANGTKVSGRRQPRPVRAAGLDKPPGPRVSLTTLGPRAPVPHSRGSCPSAPRRPPGRRAPPSPWRFRVPDSRCPARPDPRPVSHSRRPARRRAAGHLIQGLAYVGLPGCGAGLIIVAGVWGVGASSNPYQVTNGKSTIVLAALGAALIGASTLLVRYFFNLGTGVN